MLSSDAPTKIQLPFADGGTRAVIPVPSQIGITPGAASMTDGFPPLTMTPPGGGGIPVSGPEMNGILWLATANGRWFNAGGCPKFDAVFAAAIGGYPLGAVLQSADNAGWWRSTAESNTSNPDTGGAGWVPHSAYGQASVSLSSSNVTLAAAQALKPQIVLTGTLTANVNLILPATLQQWLVVNSTTGAFTVTAKTAAGTGVALGAGPNLVYGDGANIQNGLSAYVRLADFTGSKQQLAVPGFQAWPGGLIDKFGKHVIGNPPAGVNSIAVVFPVAFPNALLHLSLTVQDEAFVTNVICAFSSPTAAGFTLHWAETGAANQDITVHWLARGY